jgi:hypothetical protein
VILANNTFRYLTCLRMPSVPPDAAEPQLTEEALAKLGPYTNELVDRLNQGGKFKEVVQDIAHLAGVTPGQVVYYVRALIAEQRGSSRD